MRHENTEALTKASFFVFCFALLWMTGPLWGQSTAKEGEWPSYAADLKSTRYRPFDQIDASNFSKLELAWSFKTDNLGTRPEYKLEGTPLKNSQTWTTFRASPGRKCA